MAVPKRNQLANKQSRKIKKIEAKTTDKSHYLALKYDYENNSLPEWKKERYYKLRDIYEN